VDRLFHFVSAIIGGYANIHLFTSNSGAGVGSRMDILQVALVGRKPESRIFRG
jgi:hypothetical protein